MKLIWHIITKDIVRDRWALLTWALLFVGQDALGIFACNTSGINSYAGMHLQTASFNLVFLQMAMGYVLVTRLVQADALIGTSVFWLTRPISAGRLLTAKLLGALLLFVLLPVLLLLPWWLYCQLGWREILWTAVDVAGWQLLMVGPAFLVASLTDDLGRVLLWTLLLVIGLVSWIILLQSSLVTPLARLSPLFAKVGVSVMFTRLWACSMILIGGTLAIAAHQYLTRRFARSVGLVVCCLGLIALTGQVWPWDWSRTFASLHKHKPSLATADPGLVAHLSFAVEPAKGSFGGGFKEKEAEKRDGYIDLQLSVNGLPEDVRITADYVSHTWSWGDGLKLMRSSGYISWSYAAGNAMLRRAYSLPAWQEDPETTRWRKLRQSNSDKERALRGLRPFIRWDDPEVAFRAGESQLRGFVRLPNSLLAKMTAEPPAYLAEAHWILYRPEIVAELPLKAGARTSSQGQTFYLQQMNKDWSFVVSTRSAVTQNGVWFSAMATAESRYWYPRERVAAVNRVKGDISPVRDGQSGSWGLLVAGVFVNWNVLQVTPRMAIHDNQDVVADPQWLDHTILVLLADKDVAEFGHKVEAAKFLLEPVASARSP